MDIKKIKHVLTLCAASLEVLHPIMNEDEPCIVYEAWKGATEILDSPPFQPTDSPDAVLDNPEFHKRVWKNYNKLIKEGKIKP